ncbi:WXG100 family type VII secretion target [Streptomyces sp. BV129]|uniref:WXG100 family type VII secretion target n=1 Tax=Streptomyces sp. BV129 TaxID=2849671 RepID=UPI001C2F002F|nr:hypothetical protein [Streptomyces sp. BV129]MBV1945435.1 hypothetical protein [Streptomyces sp. BV129]
MSEQPKQSEPKLSRTDFESMTHEQLAAMLASADMTSAAHLSSKLSDAASTIKNIGEDLMKHVKDLEWQGKAGDAFRDWGGHTASATLRLSQYAGAASEWMATVSEAINAAKRSMPDIAETTDAKAALGDAHKTIDAAKQPGARNDPDARKAAETARSHADIAQSRIDAVRQEAIQQMRRLAGTYEYSAMQVNSMAPPTFAPPAGHTGDAEWWVLGRESVHQQPNAAYAGGSTYSEGSSRSAAVGGAANPAVHRSSADPSVVLNSSRVHTPVASEPVSLDIASTDTLPRTSPSHVVTPTAGPGLPPREASPTGLPVSLPPAFTSGARDIGSATPPRLPGINRIPQVPGLARPIEGVPRMPRETGIVGGRPVNTAGRPTNIPRGTVIGNENAQGRAPMGRGVSSAPVAGESGRASNGLGSGRRLASEPGRTGQPGRVTGRPFTTGGSGLLRQSAKPVDETHASQTGRTGSAGRTTNSEKSREQQAKRPDYLVEDDETWTRADRRHLPPVVD